MDKDITSDTEYKDTEENKTINTFSKDIVNYSEPKSYPDMLNNTYRLDMKKITDYSYSNGALNMNDYFHAFCSPEKLNKLEETNVMDKYEKELLERNQSI